MGARINSMTQNSSQKDQVYSLQEGLQLTEYNFKPDSYYQKKIVETIPKFLLKRGPADLVSILG